MLKKLRELAYRSADANVGDIEISYVARIYGTSFNVAARRCEDLGLLPRGGAASLYDELKQKHESPEKRADAAGVPPRTDMDFPARLSGTLEGGGS